MLMPLLVVALSLGTVLPRSSAAGINNCQLHAASAEPGSNATTRVARLLLMLPDLAGAAELELEGGETEPWDRGLEILPAAQLAVEEINADPGLLQDVTLELCAVDIAHCQPDIFASNYEALVPFANIASDAHSNVLAVVGGPFCPLLLSRLVSPLASRRESHLFQISGSTAETVRKKNETVHKENETETVHFITPSIALHYETMYAVMRAFNWSKIYIIAESFFKGLNSIPGGDTLDITFRQFFSSSSSLFRDLRESEKNIVFASVGPRQAADVLCRASEESLVFPDYVWIFHDLTPDLIKASNNNRTCTADALDKALDGTFFLQFPFQPKSPNTTLVSGRLYSEYVAEYNSRLGENLSQNPYANVVYDSIWAVGHTLNRSLATSGQTLAHFLNRDNRQSLIALMDRLLPEVSFEGTSGSMNFMYPDHAVDIYSYRNKLNTRIGSYQASTNVSIDGAGGMDIPKDFLARVNVLLPASLISILATAIVACLVLTTIVLVLFIHFRQDSDIKATSPLLSYLMFLGCYLLFVSTLVHTVRGVVVVRGAGLVVVCGAVITGNILGVNLIFTTLMLRMLRVYRIFSYFGKTSKIWSNKYMVCIVGVVLLGDVVLIVVWSVVDTYRIIDVTVFQPNTKPPRYEIKQFCHSDHLSIWLGLLLGKLGVLFVIVLFLAVKTRKIQKSNFKDTKKVNIYIFSTVMVVITFMTLFFLFLGTENALAAHLMVFLAFGVTGLLCQLFLFVPKVVSPLLRKYGYEVKYDATKRRRSLEKVKVKNKKTVLKLVYSSGNRSAIV